jgi:hypothetical protein
MPFHLNKRWAWVLGIIAGMTLIVFILSYFVSSDTLRRYMEHRMNSKLKGYTVHIGRAYLHPIAFSLDLDDLSLTQDAAPDPPVAYIRQLHASVHWRELLSAHLVGDFLIDGPKVYINLKNIRKEAASKVPFKERGWQEALESIYPLKINVFTINDGDLTYLDEGPYRPLHLSRIKFQASNIRNIRSPENVYPSSLHLEGTIFDKGTLILDGNANFLQEPHLGLKAGLNLSSMDLSYFEPIMKRSNISVRSGTLSTKGNLEYNPKKTEVNLTELDINGVKVDYLHLPETVDVEQERIETATETAKELSNKPTAKLRIDALQITDSTFGYINKTTQPNYRLFFDHTKMTMTNLSNQFKEGESTLKLTGKFMGTGDTRVTGTFRAETKEPDFDLNIAIENTQMSAMSDLFRSFGNFDIKAGLFSFYSELKIKGDKIDGYVKPLFKDMEVYDRREYQEKNLFHKLYVGLVGGISKLLKNRPRHEVATEAKISGTIASPQTSTFQVIINLIKNAFIKSILPGFEKEATSPQSSAPPSAHDHSSPAAAGAH